MTQLPLSHHHYRHHLQLNPSKPPLWIQNSFPNSPQQTNACYKLIAPPIRTSKFQRTYTGQKTSPRHSLLKTAAHIAHNIYKRFKNIDSYKLRLRIKRIHVCCPAPPFHSRPPLHHRRLLLQPTTTILRRKNLSRGHGAGI